MFYLDYFLEKINELEDKTEREILKDFAYINSYIISRHHGKLVELEQYLSSLSGRNIQGEDLGVRARAWLEKWKKGEWREKKFLNSESIGNGCLKEVAGKKIEKEFIYMG